MDEPRRARLGGIHGLSELVTEFGEALEADLLRFYRVDLADLTTGRLTWRRLRVLIRALPPDSALHRQIAGPWGAQEHLLADVYDAVMVGNWQRAAVNRKKGTPVPPAPEPHARPGDRRRGRGVTPAQMRAWKSRHANRLAKAGDRHG